ncbi:MAG TPA: choice-of-anchor D domain-containing protein, partial [Polyangiaceae bacterium]|nr:choice-of-anchor D domain-containing protein [Polyangiaceae bacterium]
MTGRVRVPSCCAAALWLPALLLFGCKLDDRRFADLGAGAGGSTMFGPGAGDDRPDASGGLVEGPQLVVARTELDLGAAVTGFAALGRVVVENGGNAPVGKPVFTLAEGSDPDFSIAQDQCGHALAGGERCDVRVQVVPSKPGPLRGTLQIYSDPGGMASVALSGEGLSPGDIVLAPVPGGVADYGDVPLGMGVEAVFRVDNPVATATGVLQASLASEAFVLVPPVDGECAFGTTSLAGGQACDVRVAFQPSVRGPAEGTLSVSSPNLGAASLALRGQGRAPGALAVSTETVDFAGIVLGKGGSAQLSVLNDGDEPVTIASVTVDGDAADAFPIAATECAEGTMLEGGEQAKPCAIDLAFRPKAAGAATATLHVASTTGVEVAVALAGQGLLPGALSIAPSGDLAVGADGAVDLGDIVIGEGRVQAFQVSNGGAEPSGVITLAASSGVMLVPASGEGDCQSGVTTLVDGQSCTVSVQLEPSKRAPLSGSLTVTSELVGSASLALRAQGISKGVLELGAEDVNFGRVVLGAKAPASLAIRNGGDQPLEPPSVAVGRATSGSAAAFTFENGCTEALAAGAECSIDLTFEPMAAGAHSATLDVGAAADGNSSVLLLGDALEPGSLALAAAPGSSAAFGDVARGATVEKSFTVSNGGGVASGRLTITTTSNQFVPDQGNCNPPGSSGLVDGSSCTFAVRFTPTSANPVTATLNIDSPGAGAASLALSGRGRAPPLLDGSSEFNFEVVIVGERSDPPRPWAVTNRGDLPTAALSTMGATSEFLVNNDGCAGQVLPAGGTCNMQVSFAPQQAGARSGSISVREAGASGSSVRLGVSGVGQALPAVGQACQGG